MDLDLSVDGDDAAEGLAELQDWLRQEPEFRGRVTAVGRPPQPGELGVVTDLLSVAASSGGALSVLAASLKAFFAQPRRADLKVTITAPDGRKIEVDAKRVKDVDALLQQTIDQAR